MAISTWPETNRHIFTDPFYICWARESTGFPKVPAGEGLLEVRRSRTPRQGWCNM